MAKLGYKTVFVNNIVNCHSSLTRLNTCSLQHLFEIVGLALFIGRKTQ